MNLAVLQELACPQCRDERGLHVSSGSEVHGTDLLCGYLECQCGHAYPVIDGAALLVRGWKSELSKHRRYLERSVPSMTVPEELRGEFAFTSRVEPAVAEEVLPYVFNHLCFSGIAFDKNPIDEVRSPRLTALIAESAASGPYQLLRRYAEGGRGARHLDIGCSVGTAIAISAEQGADISLGLDISFPAVHAGRAMIPVSVDRKHGVAELVVGEAESLPVRSAAWSLVSALNVVDAVDVPSAVVNELSRAVAPDGQLLIAAPFREDSINFMGGTSGLLQVEEVLDIPWIILRGPRYLEFLSVDAYVYHRPAQADAERS